MLDTVPAERASGMAGGGRGKGYRIGNPGKETNCVVRVVRVSGTIRKSEEELLRRARRDIIRAREDGSTEGVLEEMFGGGKGKEKQSATALRGDEAEGIFDDDMGDEVDLEDDD
jgi:ribonuclease P/MRP protein subunit POP5